MSREEAYRIVQRHAHSAWNSDGGNFRANLKATRMTAAQLIRSPTASQPTCIKPISA